MLQQKNSLSILVFILCNVVLTPAHAVSIQFFAKVCPGLSADADKAVAEKMSRSETAFLKTSRAKFFVGLWSQLADSERPQVSKVLALPDAELEAGLQQIMNTLADRILQDRAILRTWIRKHNLESEIEVFDHPESGYFLFVNATKKGIKKIRCASAAGYLPAVLSNL